MSPTDSPLPPNSEPVASPEPAAANGSLSIPSTQGWPAIIAAVKSPLGFFSLIALVISGIMVGVGVSVGQANKEFGIILAIGSVVIMLAEIIVVHLNWRSMVGGLEEPSQPVISPLSGIGTSVLPPPNVSPPGEEETSSSSRPDSEVEGLVKEQGGEVLFFGRNLKSKLDVWQQDMRPYLHQAAHYSIPMYFLDTNLNVIDWNIAFDIVFSELTGHIRGKHVNWFIARTANFNDVFDHARKFTREVIEKNAFPYVDMEPIDYFSPEYRLVRTVKVATQLTDSHGESRGWSVALIPKVIDWEKFEPRLMQRIHDDKMWSVYSASYDRVLRRFPPYQQLIDEVTAVVPDKNLAVLDLGCGTGNVTETLLQKGHRVTAIEENLGMLDRFAAKSFNKENVKLIKASVEHLDFLSDKSFDAAVMVNVLYALENPLECLRSVHRVLRDGGVLGLSTTHRETKLDPLLRSIRDELERIGKFEKLAADFAAVDKVNRRLETTVVRRHTRDEVRKMVQMAGFDIIRDVPAAYENAVMILHVRKRPEETTDTSKPAK